MEPWSWGHSAAISRLLSLEFRVSGFSFGFWVLGERGDRGEGGGSSEFVFLFYLLEVFMAKVCHFWRGGGVGGCWGEGKA